MRKSLYIGMVMCLLSGWTARAQRTVDLDFRQVTLNVLFDAIERQTGQPVYRQPLETDSMVVSVHSEKEEPLVALRRALEGTPFQVSSYGGAFFVLRDNTLMTSLPENFFLREKRREGDGDEEGSGISLMAGRKQQKATSENKVYEIGDASGKAADRVTVTGNISDFKTGEPMDKAGAYGVQSRGALFVEHIDGDFFNVMGLPVEQLGLVLARFGVKLL